jgi:hypothetical protein
VSHPYVPLSTPVTITVDGFWDGDHNGNQPVVVVPNGQGENKKFHLPHGARVHTRPNVVEAVAFTVDKPAPKPKLRTIKDGTGALAFEVAPDLFWFAVNRAVAQSEYAARDEPGDGFSYGDLVEWFSPLTDVTDTGEPLDEFGEPLAQWEKDLLAEEPDDAPPQPGDRVRVTPKSYEAEYVRHSVDVHHVKFDNGGTYMVGEDADIRVIARAKPAVPEDPRETVLEVNEETGGGTTWEYKPGKPDDLYRANEIIACTWEQLWEYSRERGSKLHTLVTTRGPVIGG